MANSNEAKYTQLEALMDEQLCALSAVGNRMAEEILVARYHLILIQIQQAILQLYLSLPIR